MNLISGTHHSCERREHAFMILWEYTIICLLKDVRTLLTSEFIIYGMKQILASDYSTIQSWKKTVWFIGG